MEHKRMLQREHFTVGTSGPAALRDWYTNKDTGFSQEERDKLGIRGLLPPRINTLEEQGLRIRHQLDTKLTPIQKHIALFNLRQRNERLFYYFLLNNLRETLPLVYTPTVGEACQKFSHMFRRPEGLTITIEDKGRVADVVANWPQPTDMPRIAVITDGSRILGLGDLGWNGLGIALGKLSLYVAGAGIDPRSTLPIVVDLGTNTEEYLNDPLYLGLPRRRASHEEYLELLDEIMEALHKRYPSLIIQFEDWSSDHAFEFLERYQLKYPMFNDDIQGTGAVILAGFINAARISANAANRDVADQRILMVGAGSAAIGVAKQLMWFFRHHGLSEEEAKKLIWTTDSRGLITNDRGDKLAHHKLYFARDDNEGQQFKNLEDIVDYVKPTAIVGLSTVAGTFTEGVIRKMAEYNTRPIIFPLSNPTSNSECTFEEALKYTDGRAIFAAGSPFANVEFGGRTRFADQGNNFYIFPGIGLAGALSKAKHITDEVITAGAFALANSLTPVERSELRVYPKIERVREVSGEVAAACIRVINEQGLARDDGHSGSVPHEQLPQWVCDHMWVPSYDH
ncbi:malate dehydrogenase (oxaloacetate-decarboxylating) (NADP(+)) [Malassezia cuniculi]|uniref:Malic enzyme n=1 Tax=Malassezia cuniculi TaxID=948313 RepID=A0AAF0J621_9BASI|nr:malate dehydrogenase (oxaloacetate-decarboxylating) (NADP(+)) [Malassezia cuniculi]